MIKKTFQSAFFAIVVFMLSVSGCAPKPWVIVESVVTKDGKPIEQQNTSDEWIGIPLAENLKFSGAFEMKFAMESVGENFINLTYSEGSRESWWQGTKRMEISCRDGKLGVALRDGSSESYIYEKELEMPSSNAGTSCQLTIKFDQSAKNVEFFQNNKSILRFTSEEIGDFPGGLFPNGEILKVDLSSPPNAGNSNSGVKYSSVKLVELVFSVPPSE